MTSRNHDSFTAAMAAACARRPWITVIVWTAVLVAAVAVFVGFSGAFQAKDDFTGAPESKRADLLMAQRLPGARNDVEMVVVRHPRSTVDDAAYRKHVTDLAQRLRSAGKDQVVGVRTAYDGDKTAAMLVSADRHTTLLPVTLAGGAGDADAHFPPVYRAVTAADGRDGFAVAVTGNAAWERDASELGASDLRRGELIGIPIALIILVAVFGALMAATLPLVLAVFAIAVGAALTALIGQTFDLSVFALNIITMMGLAVGIDYSLFIVSRYREERAAGKEKVAAIAAAGETAGRAVFFSGVTVVLALLGMLIVPFSIFPSLGVGAITAVLGAVAAALTLLPAILSLLGDRVDALRVPWLGRRLVHPERPGFWGGAARRIMRRPALSLVLGVALLAAVAAPTLLMERGPSDAAALPDDLTTKRGLVMMQRAFPAGLGSPVQVVVDGPSLDLRVLAALKRFQRIVAEDGRFTPIGLQTSPSGTLSVIELVQDAGGSSPAAIAGVEALREELVPAAFAGSPAEVLVGGTSAAHKDAMGIIDTYMPIVIGLVLALSLVLLLIAFGSPILAVTAVLMNLLSVGAAYGALTLVFQEGIGASLFGFTQADSIEAWVPLLMFCVLFGLSMDYQVFLLSRIRERWEATHDARASVTFGVQSTAGLITGAALIMVAVFAGVASGRMAMFQQMGFGLAVAVLIDATIVRTVVAPATIALIGPRFWWRPRLFDRAGATQPATGAVRPVGDRAPVLAAGDDPAAATAAARQALRPDDAPA